MRSPTSFGPLLLTGVAQTLYTATQPTRLSNVTIVNPTAAPVNAIIYVVPMGAVVGSLYQVVPATPLPPFDTIVMPQNRGGTGGSKGIDAWLMLNAGDTVQAVGAGLLCRGTVQEEN